MASPVRSGELDAELSGTAPERPSLAIAGQRTPSETSADRTIDQITRRFSDHEDLAGNLAALLKEAWALHRVRRGGTPVVGVPIHSLVRDLFGGSAGVVPIEAGDRGEVIPVLLVCGLFAGMLNGYMAVGPDLVTFFVASCYLRWPLARAISASVQVAGHTSLLSGALYLSRGDVPMELWPMVLPGLWFGARLGAVLLELLGRVDLPCTTRGAPASPAPRAGAQGSSRFRQLFWPAPAGVHMRPAQRRWNAAMLFGLGVAIAVPSVMLTAREALAAVGMPFMGMAGATIAVSTPVGGAILFIPVLTTMGIAPQRAVAFGVATQMVGMGTFGFGFRVRAARCALPAPPGAGGGGHHSKEWRMMRLNLATTKWLLLGAWGGVLLSIYVVPLTSAAKVRLLFACAEAFLLAYLEFGAAPGALPGNMEGKGLLHSLWLAPSAQWKSQCSSSHVGCTSWVSQRGEARLGFLFKALLLGDLVRTVAMV